MRGCVGCEETNSNGHLATPAAPTTPRTAKSAGAYGNPMSPSTAGIGAVLGFNRRSNEVVFSSYTPGSPSQEANERGDLQSGDVLQSIDGQPLKESVTMYDVAALILGPSGTEVSLTVVRDGEVKEVVLERRETDVKTARDVRESTVIPNGVAVVI
eukprot:CAMPEP_0181344010 /NCGR_PEP_ID=MMETSP1101-20121128/31929_1 /TAXON_ID=46948 /ORGANISM="Rhodomonas abbreviata, Strain Caron Lab Isolate" /LENGTH=155 /DNA_ID=CAMNT_0023455753 /DNA_START=307 /DNA_END=774 /DNA_ORIENTATION=-